ncbi:hypothetical protein D915_001564 [Fasciola hepatica]|uniref:Uncharacterized protein n=1 Tax=Fasciola hepatica TaxID=6192 RepID=A0A2H1CRP1_FASHE|nr:hypothetical protein D915_001564 [Fasciola hepatica]
MTVIGIDLGTSNSLVAVPVGSEIEVLSIPTLTPVSPVVGRQTWISTTVQFSPCERLVGVDYFRTANEDPKNRIFHIKRLLGRAPSVLSQLKQLSYWPFDVSYVDNRPVIKVMYRHVERKYAPEQLAAMVLERLRHIAEERLGAESVTDVVLACPSSFTTCQREALMNAACIAGMRVRSLLNDTTAATIAFRVQTEFKTPKKLLVFDMGGGSTNVSVISVQDEQFDVIASTGNNTVGGEDFTGILMGHFIEIFYDKHGKDLRMNELAMERLRQACDKAKCTLSVQPQAHISLMGLHEGINFSSRITRTHFETLCQSLFKRIERLMEFILRESHVTPTEIDDVLLLGGSSRIPRVQAIVAEYCASRSLNRQLSPEEAVVFGTGVYAKTMTEEMKAINGMGPQFTPCVTDVIAHSLGVEVNDDTFNPIVQRNKTLPLKASKIYSTAFTNQSIISFNVLAGDCLLAKYNENIGNITVLDIPPAEAGDVRISLVFRVDRNGLLQISANARQPGCRITDLNIRKTSFSLTGMEVEEMIEEAKKLQLEDQENNKLASAKKALIEYVEMKQKQLRKQFASGHMSDVDHDFLQNKCDSVKLWVAANPACSKYRYKQKQAELDVLWDEMTDGHKNDE